MFTSSFGRTYSMGTDPFNIHTRKITKLLTDNAPSMVSYSLLQKPTSQYNQKTGQPANVNEDFLAVDTARQNNRQYLNSYLRDMKNVSNNLYSMLVKVGNFPIDSTAMNSLGAVITQNPISYNGGEVIMTDIVIHKCCVGELCYTPDKDKACDPTKIPVSRTYGLIYSIILLYQRQYCAQLTKNESR